MCGIAGIVANSEALVRLAIPRMLAAQEHRGPDDFGEHYVPFGRGFLGLGHRRLAILDTSRDGHQPMAAPETGSQIVYNGEIYNFASLREELVQRGRSFRSRSDTEVLLAALEEWGPDACARLHGMFAFAYHDVPRQRLVLARDSLGIKPLYWAEIEGGLLFASEVRALLASGLVGRGLDRVGIAGLLAFGAVQHPRTVFAQVRSMAPGHCCTISAGGAGPRRTQQAFWKLPTPSPSATGGSSEEAVAQVRTTLDAAVKDHLVSDVPVGVFLSSGLDSTIVAGIAARHAPHLRAFTVGFADQPDRSEAPVAEATARAFGLPHTTIQIGDHEAQAAALEWLDDLDQPSIDGLNTYVIAKFVKAQGITVVLSGQGGDEVFCGYSTFRDVPRLRTLQALLGWLPGPLRDAVGRVLALGRPAVVRQKLTDVLGAEGSLLASYLQRRRALSSGQLEALGISSAELGIDESYLPPEALADAALPAAGGVAATLSAMEARFYLGNMLLRDGDATTMAHSLELRVPMLDRRVLDLVLALPEHVRAPRRGPHARRTKVLLRKAFPELLRDEVNERPKSGFTLPLGRWLAGPMREMAEGCLRELEHVGVLRPEGIRAIWKAFLQEPESPMWSRAMALVACGRYLHQNLAAARVAASA